MESFRNGEFVMNRPDHGLQSISFFPRLALIAILSCLVTTADDDCTSMTAVTPQTVLELGEGWANNTVNTVIFRHHGIVTRGDYQFTAYYNAQSQMVFVKRDLRDNRIESYIMPGTYNTRDAHNAISLGIDPEGFVHVSYDHHGSPLHYRRSHTPLRIDDWSEPLSMTGELEHQVTYPYFIQVPSDRDDPEGKSELWFLYRHGGSGNGDICLKVYNHHEKQWADRALRFVKGMEQKPWTSNAYWNHPVFDSTGRFLLTWVWRVNRGGPPELVSNHNIGFAQSHDRGASWQTAKGLPLSLPMTQVNSETIWAISPGSNLINQCSSAIDSLDRLHVVYYADDYDGVPQYQHLWFNGRYWQNDLVSRRTGDFELRGGGTLRLPISRPEIVIDRRDNLYIIARGDMTGDRLAAIQLSKAPEGADRRAVYAPDQAVWHTLWDRDHDHAEPVIDRIRWQRDGVLSMLIQKNHQPNHDRPEDVPAEPVYIVDWVLPSSTARAK